ncbi:MAG: AAA family ATPase [bacterium]
MKVPSTPKPSPARKRTLQAASAFGLDADAPRRAHQRRAARLGPVAEAALSAVAGGGVVLITGPSGAGKSTLLELIAARLPSPRRIDPQAQLRDIRAPICTLSGQPLDQWLAHLARFGLAEAMLWLQRPGELSAGQRWRLAFALRFVGARPTLICDEACAMLDRMTAVCICMNLRREATRSPGARLILATSHDDLLVALNPDVHVRLDLGGHARVQRLRPPVGAMCEVAKCQAGRSRAA